MSDIIMAPPSSCQLLHDNATSLHLLQNSPLMGLKWCDGCCRRRCQRRRWRKGDKSAALWKVFLSGAAECKLLRVSAAPSVAARPHGWDSHSASTPATPDGPKHPIACISQRSTSELNPLYSSGHFRSRDHIWYSSYLNIFISKSQLNWHIEAQIFPETDTKMSEFMCYNYINGCSVYQPRNDKLDLACFVSTRWL